MLRHTAVIAQALLEKGLLDSLATGIGTAVDYAQTSFAEHPWVWIFAGVAVLVILLKPPLGKL